jgi:large subunit ribosomal protein L25
MAQQQELEVTRRDVLGKAAKRLRKAGIIPANIYGHKEASLPVQITAIAFEHLQRAHATRSIISLRMPDTASPQTVLIRHVQRDPRNGKVIHIDFFRVSMSERINVKVPLRFVGEAPGVTNEGGVLLHLLDALEVECVASDIPEYIEVDVTLLAEIDDILHAGDIKLPANFTLLTDPEEGVAKVAATRAEVAEEAAAAPAAEEAPAPAETATQQAGSEA